jgi:outer membrane protein assembly factor BamB
MDAWWYSFPAVKGDLLYMGTADADYRGDMYLGYYAYSRQTGKIVWEQQYEGVLYRGDDRIAYNLLRRNVELLDFMAPTVWNDFVIFTGGDRVARAFDAKTGVLRWEQTFESPISSAPTIASGRVYFGLLGNDLVPPQLVCISARDGKVQWQMETEGALLSAPVIAGKRIIFGTDKSVFYVLEQVL